MRSYLLLCIYPCLALATSACTQVKCSTKLGKSSLKHVPTVSHTTYTTVTAYKKVCRTASATITPSAKTSTTTSTTTTTVIVTSPLVTDTITQTNTETETDTETDTATTTTTTVTTTEVSTTPTYTVPTPAGFTPIESVPGYVPKNKRDIPGRLAPRASQAVAALKKISDGKVCQSTTSYPTAVSCTKTIKSTTTHTTTTCTATCKKTLPVSTVTQTATVTATTTSTVVTPDAISTATTSTTITTTTTTTTTETDTATSTDTETAFGPTATVYAACAANNILLAANGNQGLNQVSTPGQEIDTGDTTAYDCCVSCQNTPNCNSALFGGDCEIRVGTTCNPGSNPATYQTNPNFGAGEGFILSDGPCGIATNGGTNDYD